ncbi:MAG: hypothetical protein WED06_00085 [Candidatus Paceibacterota bacterium]
MAKQDYIPGKEGNLAVWLQNYKDNLAVHKGTLGVTDAEYNAQVAFVNALLAAIVNNTNKQGEAQQARTDLNTQKSTSVSGIRIGAQKIKKKDAYNNGIGEDLGIVGDENSIDIENSKPALTAKKVETGWRFSFNLLGFFDSVKIFRTRPGGAKTFIAIDTSSPYIDTEPMVNATEYTAYYMLGDNSVGLESDKVTISI